MKIFVFVIILIIGVFFVAICDMAGGISRNEVKYELSQYVFVNEAAKIIRNELCVDTNLLVRISTNNLSSDAMTVLLRHPLFPQWRRNEVIDEGRDGFYLDNAILDGSLTDEDVQHWVKQFFISESLMECALKDCPNLSEESKSLLRQRIENTFIYRLRKLIGIITDTYINTVRHFFR